MHNWALKNEIEWNVIENKAILFQENAKVCKMSAI